MGSPRPCGRSPVSTGPFCADGLAAWALRESGTGGQRRPGCPLGTPSFSQGLLTDAPLNGRRGAATKRQAAQPSRFGGTEGGGAAGVCLPRASQASPAQLAVRPADAALGATRKPCRLRPPAVASVDVVSLRAPFVQSASSFPPRGARFSRCYAFLAGNCFLARRSGRPGVGEPGPPSRPHTCR